MHFIFFCCVLTSLFALTHGARFLSPLPDGTVVYECAGSSVTLSWQYELNQGDHINHVRWYYEGSSNTLIAYYSHGSFLPLPVFAQRVEFVANGGLELRNLTTSDSGRYFVEISGVDGNGQLFQHVRHVLLEVDDGGLQVTLSEDAVLDNVTGKWSLVLSCGRFTYIGQPASPVEWVTPSGRVVWSSKYESGYFKLHLTTSSVEGGRYVCRVPTSYSFSSCLSDSQAARNVSVTVDKMDARMTLLEAELRSLKQQHESQSDIRSLTQEVSVQKTNLNALAATHLADNATLSRMINDAVVPLVAFNARSIVSLRTQIYGEHLKFNKVLYNQGNGYNSTTGDFTAPVSGTYFFSFQTQNVREYEAFAYISVNDQYVCEVYSYDSVDDNAFCNGIVYLAQGQKAWVQSMSNYNFFIAHRTAFTGFLINDGS